MTAQLWLGVLLCTGALGLAAVAAVLPSRRRIPRSRLDPTARPASRRLSGAAEGTTALLDGLLDRGGSRDRLESALERAGTHARPAELLLVVAGAAVGAGVFGLVLGGPAWALVLAAGAPAAAALYVDVRRRRRQAAFTGQLDDSLQLLAGSLRAGHSVLRALDAVSRDTESPTSDEFARVVNETRVGRDVNVALAEVAERTGSEDFAWVVQAIGIHREVGGNLAEVLDRVAATIRDRNELRREATALSAEGRVSGVVLLLMPLVVVGVLLVVAPGYLGTLFDSGAGIVLVGLAGLLMTVGALWLRQVVTVRF